MAEQSGFFDSKLIGGEYDRTYLANSFAKYFASFIGNGVFGGKLSELMVSQKASPEMKIEVMPGMGWINGYWYENTSNLSFNIEVADGILNRIDCVVLRWSQSDRSIIATIKKGVFASTAVAPSIQRDADVYELKLAEIYIKAGTTSITQKDIKDTRFDEDACGLVTGLISQIDVTEFSGLLNSILNEIEIKTMDEINSLIDRLSALVEDKNALASLALEVNDVKSKIAIANQTLGYDKKNLNKYPYHDKSKTYQGMVWTDNGDGTVTANGTAEYQVVYTFNKYLPLKPGRYKISSGLGTAYETYFTYIIKVEKNNPENRQIILFDFVDTYFEVTNQDIETYWYEFAASITKGVTVSNIVFKPMIRRAEILDSTWEPYKLSVAEMIQEDETNIGCFYRMNRTTGIKEWLNAPNVPGIEYCLTERWNNKPVYQTTFYLSVLPNKAIASLSTGVQWDKVISINAYALDSDDLTYYPFPVILQNQVTPIAFISKVESDGALVITTTIDASYLKAYVTVKYTKA